MSNIEEQYEKRKRHLLLKIHLMERESLSSVSAVDDLKYERDLRGIKAEYDQINTRILAVQTLRQVIEPRFNKFNLGEEKIKNQTLQQLEESLRSVQEFLVNPGQFFSFADWDTLISEKIPTANDQSLSRTVKSKIVRSLLTERKEIISERIRFLKEQEQIVAAQEKVSQIDDVSLRNEIAQLIEEVSKKAVQANEQNLDSKQREAQIKMDLEAFNNKQIAEIGQRKLEEDRVRSKLRTLKNATA